METPNVIGMLVDIHLGTHTPCVPRSAGVTYRRGVGSFAIGMKACNRAVPPRAHIGMHLGGTVVWGGESRGDRCPTPVMAHQRPW